MSVKQSKESVLKKTIQRCRERHIIIPTLSQQISPEKIPAGILEKLKPIGLWDIHPLNLFRITWKNNPYTGLFGGVNFIEIPEAITGVKARILGLVGKYFPTGAHKVGAAFGCLVPPLVQGEFDPDTQKAIFPSTGNYCRGGAFDCALLGCKAVAILPEGMSTERFEWLEKIGAEVIRTHGCESNVKEIYDKCWELKKTQPQNRIFNQFEEFGNSAWHYHVTGRAAEEAFQSATHERKERLSAFVSATGSAGTIAAGDYLKHVYPDMKIAAAEALQCPTLLENGFGDHRIEGIGDKHVPWIHNVRNTDAVIAIDDEDTLRVLRLFNETAGQAELAKNGISKDLLSALPLLGISSICNLIASIKMARFFEMNERDVIVTVLTDSAEMYRSRLAELTRSHGTYSEQSAHGDLKQCLHGATTEHMRKLDERGRRALHNLKYFTWVEQQGKTAEELRTLWEPEFWLKQYAQVTQWDQKISEFNEKVGH